MLLSPPSVSPFLRDLSSRVRPRLLYISSLFHTYIFTSDELHTIFHLIELTHSTTLSLGICTITCQNTAPNYYVLYSASDIEEIQWHAHNYSTTAQLYLRKYFPIIFSQPLGTENGMSTSGFYPSTLNYDTIPISIPNDTFQKATSSISAHMYNSAVQHPFPTYSLFPEAFRSLLHRPSFSKLLLLHRRNNALLKFHVICHFTTLALWISPDWGKFN